MKLRTVLAAIAVLVFQTNVATAQIQIAPSFAGSYSFIDLGAPAGVPGPFGGLTVLSGNSNTLLIGGAANSASGAIYQIGITRDANNHITGFTGTATTYATAPNIDGGLAYGPGGVLFYTGYPNNVLGQIKPGSTTPDKVIDLTAAGVSPSVGSLLFVPNGFPGAGGLRMLSYNGGGFYGANLTPDGSGTYDVSGVTLLSQPNFGPEGAIYVPQGSPIFSGPSMLISEYGANRISAYSLDANGAPDPASRADFMTGLGGAEGAFVDPLSGDFLFSTFGGGSSVIVVRGFAVPEPSSMILAGLGAVGGWRLIVRKRRKA